MKVFISQSLQRALELAQALEPFIRKVIPGTEPWVSNSGLDKGSRLMSEIRDNLNQATGGIVCITSENRDERWLLYEAGALSTKVTDRVWTILLDIEPAEIQPPLSEFLHTNAAEKDDVFRMIQSIYKTAFTAGRTTTTEADVKAYFEAFWPTLESKIRELQARGPAPRARLEPMAEVLSLVRQIADRAGRGSWKQDKTLGMLHQIYRATVGTAAPSLEELAELQRRQSIEIPIPAGHLTFASGQSANTPLALRIQSQAVVVEPSIVPPADDRKEN